MLSHENLYVDRPVHKWQTTGTVLAMDLWVLWGPEKSHPPAPGWVRATGTRDDPNGAADHSASPSQVALRLNLWHHASSFGQLAHGVYVSGDYCDIPL